MTSIIVTEGSGAAGHSQPRGQAGSVYRPRYRKYTNSVNSTGANYQLLLRTVQPRWLAVGVFAWLAASGMADGMARLYSGGAGSDDVWLDGTASLGSPVAALRLGSFERIPWPFPLSEGLTVELDVAPGGLAAAKYTYELLIGAEG